MRKKKFFILFLISLLVIIILSSFPNIGYTIGGYSPEEFELMTKESLTRGGVVKLGYIKYNSFFWAPIKYLLNDKFSYGKTGLFFLITLPYWIVMAAIFSFVVDLLIKSFTKIRKRYNI